LGLNRHLILIVGRSFFMFVSFPDSSLKELVRWNMNEVVEIAAVRLHRM
jgi:hypothetical protein